MKLKFINGKKSKVFILIASLILIALTPFGSSDPIPFSITEINTDYSIAENVITLEAKDLIDKDQFITDISEIFADHPLTDEIEIKEVLLNQSYESDIYGNLNESQGKYKTFETVEECYNETVNETYCYNVTYYYDDLNNTMDCDYTLDDKTCLKTVYTVIGTETKYDFLNLPTTKEKIVIDGLKIEQKQDGLSIPLPKGGTVRVKIRYSHPLAYRLEVPENVNKYNVSMTTADGSVILDPYWDINSSFTIRYLINCTNMDDLTPIVINGSDGFTINGEKQIVWTYCSGTGTALYLKNSTDYTDYVVANDTTQIPFEVEFGNGTSYNPTDVWDSNYKANWNLDELNAKDSTNIWNCTNTNMDTGNIVSGFIGNSLSFNGVDEYVACGDIDIPTNKLTLEGWVYPRKSQSGDYDFPFGKRDCYTYSYDHATSAYRGNLIIKDASTNYFGSAQVSIPINSWHYWVGTYDGTYLKVYVNGTLKNSNNIGSKTLQNNAYQFDIGAGAVGNLLNSIIDSVRISDVARSSDYINQTYQNAIGTSGFGELGAEESAPVVYTMGGIVKDSSNVVVNNATVIIIDQSDNTITGTTDSNSTGGWTYNVTNTGTYLVVAYDPNNSTRDGDADPWIVVS